MVLGEYLQRAMAEPWAWGLSDCSTFAADWILDQTGQDPMDAWRAAYTTADEAEDLIAEAGGLAVLFGRGIDPIWLRTTYPEEGAVGVVAIFSETGFLIDVGAIFTGKRWAIKSPRGVAMITEPVAVRAIWAR